MLSRNSFQVKREALKADCLAIVDLGLHKANIPALTLGIRGIITLDVELRGSTTDLHSGAHGGIVVNPIHALVELLSSLRDEEGMITIPGFYDQVIDMSPEERKPISFEFDSESYQKQIGALPFGGESAYSPLERAWIRPTLEINGIWGGYTGQGFKTVIPAKAFAKISCRLVSNQDPSTTAKLVAAHLTNNTPPGVEVHVNVHAGQGKAVRVLPHSHLVQCFAKAFEDVFEHPCEFGLEGGSIPIVTELAEASEAETILLGLGLATDQIHAPNEHFGLDRLEKGMLVMARAMEIIAAASVKNSSYAKDDA